MISGADLGRKPLDKLVDFVKGYKAKGLAWIQLKEDGVKSSIAKFLTDDVTENIIKTMGAETGDAILIVADKNSVVFQSLGALRLELAKQFDLIKDKNEFNFTWITEFPLFEYNEEEDRYHAAHHPFTSPMDEDLDMLESNPGAVRSKAYDLVLNGEELGGGSIRIHDSALQTRMFKALGFTEESAYERFGFLIDAFKFGPPPHGGLAFGLDRRGLDYYTKTIFEILNDEFTVCGGGRYDKLIEQLGGPEMPAVGFGMGIERLIMILEKEGIEIPNENLFDLYIGARGDNAKFEAFTLANKLREVGVKTEVNHMGRSVKAEMKYANKIGAAFTTILGDDELQNKSIKLKRMSDGEQFEVSLDNIEEIANAIK